MQNYMKTILSGIQTWVKGKIKQSTADWNQNDSSADSFIKNRTHYEEKVENILVDNLTFEQFESGEYPKCNFVPDRIYSVIWNGTTYDNLKCYYDGEFNIIADESLGCPFYIDDGGNGLYIEGERDEDGDIPFIVSIIEHYIVIHQLDPKFIPEDAISVQPDWNQNDPNAKDYIKNRTHYIEQEKIIWTPEQVVTLNTFGHGTATRDDSVAWPLAGCEYEVIFDGISYTGVTYEDADVCIHTDFTTANDEFVQIYDGASIVAPASWAGEHTIQINYVQSTYHTLDDKFISENMRNEIAKVAHKMNVTNPVGTGTFSMGRKTGTTSGAYSFALGSGVTASGDYSHAEGSGTTASGSYSHAEGSGTTASGSYSHAEGMGTAAQRKSQHTQGEYNILDITGTISTRGTYAHIIGNGTSNTMRSNAHTLDWDGNAWYSGDVYVGSTSGTNKDEGSVKLATVDELAAALEGVSGFVVQADEPEDKSVLWLDIDDNTGGSGADLSNYYTKIEIDVIMGSYINDIDTLLGGEA